MLHKCEPEIWSHSVVCLTNFVIIIGGKDSNEKFLSTREIWVYNLYTEEWKKHEIHSLNPAPDPFDGAVAAAIEGTIYTFVGDSSALWKLSQTKTGCFTWSFLKRCDEESPSPRCGHTGWEFNGKLYIFGGEGYSPAWGYLNDYGDISDSVHIKNNQLLYYDPNMDTWMNPECYGAVPSPRFGHCSTISGEKVWLFGGSADDDLNCLDDLFELNMGSLTWSQISTNKPSPQARFFCTLTATTEKQLVLHGGESTKGEPLGDTWIMDLTTQSWRFYKPAIHTRSNHAATVGLNSSAIIIGGIIGGSEYKRYHPILCVMLEPDSLQKLALHTVYKHRDELPLKFLPKKLIALLDISEK